MNELVNFLRNLMIGKLDVRIDGIDVFINGHRIGVVYIEESEDDSDIMLNKFDIIHNGKCYRFSEKESFDEDFTTKGFILRTIYSKILV